MIKYAEDLPYWKTVQSIDKALTEAKNAIVKIQFIMDGDEFRFVEEIMQSASGNERAAKVQAAASLKHSVKARVNEALRHGARRAFLNSLLLPNGVTPTELANNELAQLIPTVFGSPMIPDVVDGEYE